MSEKWTTEQKQQFWEGLGFKWIPCKPDYIDGVWEYPNDEQHFNLPSIDDLNALVKWGAREWLSDKAIIFYIHPSGKYRVHIEGEDIGEQYFWNDDPALALAEALWKVLSQ